MPLFALQVWTGEEERFLSQAQKRLGEAEVRFYWPRRNLRIKRRGVWKESLAPIFPGYLFVKSDEIDASLYHALRAVPGFIRFLLSNDHIVPLEEKDQKLLSHFFAFGEIIDKSIVYFDENRRIRILSGPLKGLEGLIIKVDRRKGRAKVRMEMYQDSFEIDFGFESLEATPVAGSGSAG
jgi:transcriptional antiterminator NusG